MSIRNPFTRVLRAARRLGPWSVQIPGPYPLTVRRLSPFESHFSLWHRKTGSVGPVEENPQMRWGKKLEDVVCDEFAALHPELSVVRAGTYRHVERHWQIAQP
jgi:predicted phage-related endonuclease